MNGSNTRFKKQCHRESLLQLRQPRRLCNAFLFFIMMMVFFPLTMPANSQLLHQLAPGIIWIGVLLAFLLLSDRFFQQDYEDGVLDQWLVSGYPLTSLILAKLVIYWIAIVFPLLVFSPILALVFGFSWEETGILIAALTVSTPGILALTTLAAAFSIGHSQKGLLTALILLPLTLPLMIFGSAVITVANLGGSVSAYLAILLAISLLAVAFLPFAIALVIKIRMED